MRLARVSGATLALLACSLGTAHAYVDPGLAGSIFQIGYLLFYGVLAALAFFFRSIRNALLAMTARLRGPRPAPSEPKKPAGGTAKETT